MKTKSDMETYFFCHNQDIILSYEKANKFYNFTHYKYVFVGKKEIDKIENMDNVIIARNLPIHIENYPYLTAYTGWYALYKNNVIKSDIVNLFEYDIIADKFIERDVCDLINKTNINIIGYSPLAMNICFIENPIYIGNIFNAIKAVYKLDLKKIIQEKIQCNDIGNWLKTSNVTFLSREFIKYMQWSELLLPYIQDDKYAGHITERMVTLYCLFNNLPYEFIPNIITHFLMDSHQTQGIAFNENNMHKLINNTL